MENNKKKIIVITIGILVAIISIVGVSYALWSFTGTQKEKNLINLDCFDITFEETENSHINLPNAYPIIDSEGKKLKPYHFKVTNKCENYANYVVQLEVKKESTLDDQYLKVMLNENDPKLLKNENYHESSELISKDTKIGYILDHGFLDVNESKEYDLRIWLDEGVMPDSTNQDGTPVQNSKWGGIVTLSATYLGENYATLAGKNIPTVTSGDGLYEVAHKDTSLEGNWGNTEYRYAGANPNNYVWFNDELWRIIGLVNVKTSSGTIEQRVKIIRDDSIGNYSWDHKPSSQGSSTSDYGSNDWTDSQLMEMLNGIYYNSESGECWKGVNTEKVDSQTTCNFDGTNGSVKGLKNVQEMIDKDIIWDIGGSNTYEDVTANMFYDRERGTSTLDQRLLERKKDNTKDSNGQSKTDLFHSIALAYPSDYAYATNGGNLGRNECLKKVLFNWGNYEDCYDNNWLKPTNGVMWLLSPDFILQYRAFATAPNGYVYPGSIVSNFNEVWPTLYLKQDVKIVGGTGKETDPYKLALPE